MCFTEQGLVISTLRYGNKVEHWGTVSEREREKERGEKGNNFFLIAVERCGAGGSSGVDVACVCQSIAVVRQVQSCGIG